MELALHKFLIAKILLGEVQRAFIGSLRPTGLVI